VGHPGGQVDVPDFVLSPFNAGERPTLDETLERAVEALRTFAEKGLDAAARMVNRRDP
jgi:peptidyl-tRNA hydrolase